MLTLCARNNTNYKRAVTPRIDELLESIGLMRHVVPKDNNSLFRCISQCVFLTQSFHMIVRQHLLQYSKLQTEEFGLISQLSVHQYENVITDTKLDGELLDMHIAAKMYKINIAFYVDAHPFIPIIIETPNSIKKLNICLNSEGTYDLVFIKESVANLSMSQAIVYEIMYNHVFKLSGVHFAMREMLYDSKPAPYPMINNQVSLEKRATCKDMKELIESGITPFPYKVAKALSPKLYRNTEYDIWLNMKRDKFYGKWNNREFKEGSKCLVSINNQDYHCYIQRIVGKKDLVEVYVKNLTQKMFVEFDKLKLIPIEEDVKEKMDEPLQDNNVSTTTNNGNQFICQDTEQCESPILLNNSGLFHEPKVHRALPGQVFPPLCYVQQYQQQPVLPIDSLNFTNNSNMMHPWYIPTPTPQILPIPPSNFIDTSKAIEPHIQSMQPIPWYCVNEPNTPCIQYNNDEESGVAMDSNHAYQPWLVPEFDVPTNELQ